MISSRWPRAVSCISPAIRRCRLAGRRRHRRITLRVLFAAAGLLAALYRRERTGQGDHVDSSMQETLATQEHISVALGQRKADITTGRQPAWLGGAREDFSCSDGFVYLYVTRQHWKLFLTIWS